MNNPARDLVVTTDVLCAISNFIARSSNFVPLMKKEFNTLIMELFSSLIPKSEVFFLERIKEELVWDTRFLENQSVIIQLRKYLQNPRNQRHFFAHQSVVTEHEFDRKILPYEFLELGGVNFLFVPLDSDSFVGIYNAKKHGSRADSILKNLVIEIQILVRSLINITKEKQHEYFHSSRQDIDSYFLREALELTERQKLIYELICSGLTNRAIGRKLGYSEILIKSEATKIYKILGISGRKDIHKL